MILKSSWVENLRNPITLKVLFIKGHEKEKRLFSKFDSDFINKNTHEMIESLI